MMMMTKRALATFAFFAAAAALAFAAADAQQPPVYWLLWFDTEDYIEPASDDMALRLARELDAMGVRATFKVVGEKARVLEERGRRDVIAALALHDIGYHSNVHSIPPAPAVYMRKLGLYEGAQEFERREAQGFEDLKRIFGVTPSCYGQPGNSWAPQANVTLRKWGIPVYMDDGDHVGFDGQPFWYGGMLYAFNLKNFTMRADLNDASKLGDAKAKFDTAVAEARKRGGGVLQTYYHPTEWAATEFWDAVNFKYGANPPRSEWKKPNRRTPESEAAAFRIFFDFVRHVQATPGVRIITARELPKLVDNPLRPVSREAASALLRKTQDSQQGWSAADLLLGALGMTPRYVDGPERRGETTVKGDIARWAFEKTKADTLDFIAKSGRLPAPVLVGNDTLSLADFAATLVNDKGTSAMVTIHKGDLAFEKRIATDAGKAYNWVIHTKGYAPEELLELARLQSWTLKPALLRTRIPAN